MIDLEASLAELRGIWTQPPGIEKTPNDLARYSLILEEVKPSVVIETGIHYGGSLEWFAARVPRVVAIDRTLDELAVTIPENAMVLETDSTDWGCIQHVTRYVQDCSGPVMVVLDSDHGTETVYAEMVAYSSLVTPGSYMVVEDGIYGYLPPGPRWVGNWYDGNPLEAIHRFLMQHEDYFERVWELEDAYPTTQHPGGWLRRLP